MFYFQIELEMIVGDCGLWLRFVLGNVVLPIALGWKVRQSSWTSRWKSW